MMSCVFILINMVIWHYFPRPEVEGHIVGCGVKLVRRTLYAGADTGGGALGGTWPPCKKRRGRGRGEREEEGKIRGEREIMLVGLSYNIDNKVFAICRFAVRKKC